jgi:hypothetical protein
MLFKLKVESERGRISKRSRRSRPKPKSSYVHLGVNGIRVVENVLESDVRMAKSVREVLREDPSHVGVGRLLDGVTLSGTEEGVVGQAVQKRGFLDDLGERSRDRFSVNASVRQADEA